MKITEVWAFISVNKNGNEGVCAFVDSHTGMWMPMVGADKDRVESLKPIAREIAANTGQKVKLIHFGQGVEEGY